jgi:hypothetical protein
MIIICRSCESKILVHDNAGGQKGKCPKCTAVFTIPSATPADQAITAAAPPERSEAPPPRAASRRTDDIEEDRPRSRRSWRDEEEDDFDDDDRALHRIRHMREEDTGLSISSMVVGIVAAAFGTCGAVACGLLSVPVTGLCGLIAVILGLVGIRRGGRQFALTGITLGSIAMVLALACGVTGGTVLGIQLMRHN